MTRDEIIRNNPLQSYLENKGATLRRSGKQFATNMCPVVEHKKGHFCVSIDPDRNIWFCNDCHQGGSIIDWEMIETGQSSLDVMKSFGFEGGYGIKDFTREHMSNHPEPKKLDLSEPTAIYPYTDENGNLLYEVCRYEPKSFRQRHHREEGLVWNLENVTRVPFRLPRLVEAKSVIICEGEKDVMAAESMGLVATCCSGGSSGWLSAYGDFFKGKDVIIIEHNDPAGKKYGDDVYASIRDKAGSIKRLNLAPHKDLFDFINHPGSDIANASFHLNKAIESTPHTLKPAPLYSIEQMEEVYRHEIQKRAKQVLRFSDFMPILGGFVEKCVPGELILVLATTGIGKTAFLQTIAKATDLKTVFFELELPLGKMYERFAQMQLKCYARDVEGEYKEGTEKYAQTFHDLKNILVCPESGITPDQIENYIDRSELLFGERPSLVFVDYVGLMHKGGRKRYEALSDNAEQLKIIAKRTNTILIMASQVPRPDHEKGKKMATFRPTLFDAKDSGSLENSSNLVLGMSRPDPAIIDIEVLKNTSGSSGHLVAFNFDGARMIITEQV
jgi:hypothetical protein